jgi:hypothetical protein
MGEDLRSLRFMLARDHYEWACDRAREAIGDSAPAVAAAGRALTLEQAW